MARHFQDVIISKLSQLKLYTRGKLPRCGSVSPVGLRSSDPQSMQLLCNSAGTVYETSMVPGTKERPGILIIILPSEIINNDDRASVGPGYSELENLGPNTS